MEVVTNLISMVGFPIACVIFLWKFVNTTLKENTEALRAMTESLLKIDTRLNRLEGEVKDDYEE